MITFALRLNKQKLLEYCENNEKAQPLQKAMDHFSSHYSRYKKIAMIIDGLIAGALIIGGVLGITGAISMPMEAYVMMLSTGGACGALLFLLTVPKKIREKYFFNEYGDTTYIEIDTNGAVRRKWWEKISRILSSGT